jgi:hypothetical protein
MAFGLLPVAPLPHIVRTLLNRNALLCQQRIVETSQFGAPDYPHVALQQDN